MADSSHVQVWYLAISFMLLWACLCGFLQYLFRNGKINATKRNLTLIGFFLITGPILTYVDYELDKRDWKELGFSGRVESVEVTKQHALVRFTIVSEDARRQEVVDIFWKMRECKQGDWVSKPKGVEAVSIIVDK